METFNGEKMKEAEEKTCSFCNETKKCYFFYVFDENYNQIDGLIECEDCRFGDEEKIYEE
jgi:hypothetical protein